MAMGGHVHLPRFDWVQPCPHAPTATCQPQHVLPLAVRHLAKIASRIRELQNADYLTIAAEKKPQCCARLCSNLMAGCLTLMVTQVRMKSAVRDGPAVGNVSTTWQVAGSHGSFGHGSASCSCV